MTTARLDNVNHGSLRVLTGHGAAFGEAVNQVAVFASEFADVQRDYPILFRRDEQGMLQALAILGLGRDENLYLDGDRWDAFYIPALMRRGPFMIGFTDDGEPVIHVDLDHPRIVADGSKGEPLFLPQGGHAPALEAAVDALRTIHIGVEAANALTTLFTELKLAEPVQLQVSVSDTEVVDFEGYLAVTPEKIASLDGATLERLNKAGLLEVAVFAAASLTNMSRLIAYRQRRGA